MASKHIMTRPALAGLRAPALRPSPNTAAILVTATSNARNMVTVANARQTFPMRQNASLASSRLPRRSYATEGSQPPLAETPKAVKAAETMPETGLKRTPLYDLHIKHGAKIVPFAGYEMPLTYRWGGQLAEHAQVRSHAGIFDVSHMVQSVISGKGATQFVEHLVPASLESLRHPTPGAFGDSEQGPFLGSLSVLLNKDGGIIDDLIVTRQGEDVYYLVTNAGRRAEDMRHIRRELRNFNQDKGLDVKHDVLEGRGLIALQGPKAASALQNHVPIDLTKLYFGESAFTAIGPDSVRVHVSRGGYTGEDGFEISIPAEDSIAVTELLLSEKSVENVQLIGLAARDSLRLEAGMCLYGHDLSEDVGVLEAGLTWVVGEDRRSSASFIGAKPTLDAMAAKAQTERRVGILIESGPPAREGALIFAPGTADKPNAEPIGKVTSGIPSPTLKQNIAMGYVKFGHHKSGTDVDVKGRGVRKAQVVRLPFVSSKDKYYKRPKAAKQ